MPWSFSRLPEAHPADLEPFLAHLNTQTDLFDPTQPITVARAPGRLDLMGGIADYSGSLVLQMPLAVAAYAALQRTDNPVIQVSSTLASTIGDTPVARFDLAELAPTSGPLPYADARALFARDAHEHWAAYVAGAVVVLHHRLGWRPERGFTLWLDSQVPAGKGVSSSAAIEVAGMRAIVGAFDLQVSTRDLALWCQEVENLVVGAPCGVMDQMSAAAGQAGTLLALRCQPAELEAPVTLPDDLEIWGIDSGIRHAVSGSDYGAVRVGAFMGYRILADLAGLPSTPNGPGRVSILDPYWQGYLANIRPETWAAQYRDRLPVAYSGAEFLARYGGFTDKVTAIRPEARYAIRVPTEHPILEHARVQCFRQLLLSRFSEAVGQELGALMFASHASYSACGLGSDGTDRLVALVRAEAAAGLYGAKITGGGSGGTVAVLGRRGARAAVARVADRYAAETGREPIILQGTSVGAAAFGHGTLMYA
ncbi:MAG TPA: galactokinase family protein [Anaerolineales bacterium]|nr:galactokinase family protein [Anaerolineales bacterium]